MLRAQFEGALYFASVYAACVVYSRARSIRRARTIRGNTVVAQGDNCIVLYWFELLELRMLNLLSN